LDIFVDTGVVFGWSFDEDYFYPHAIVFVRKYPFKNNDYYSTKNILEIEINKIAPERTNGITRRLRKIMRFFKTFFDHITDVSQHMHPEYGHLRFQILQVLVANGSHSKKDRDSIFLTNAFIWDTIKEKLVTPHFITTDKNDIYANKIAIKSVVSSCLNCSPKLNIEYLPNIAK
jgi:hypothetical protein